MNTVLSKLDIQKHIYISEMLFPQIMRGLKMEKKDGYILARSAFEVINSEIKNNLDKNDSIIVLLKNILSKKKNIKSLELVSDFFELLKEDAKLLNFKDNTLYKIEEEEDFYFGNKELF